MNMNCKLNERIRILRQSAQAVSQNYEINVNEAVDVIN